MTHPFCKCENLRFVSQNGDLFIFSGSHDTSEAKYGDVL